MGAPSHSIGKQTKLACVLLIGARPASFPIKYSRFDRMAGFAGQPPRNPPAVAAWLSSTGGSKTFALLPLGRLIRSAAVPLLKLPRFARPQPKKGNRLQQGGNGNGPRTNGTHRYRLTRSRRRGASASCDPDGNGAGRILAFGCGLNDGSSRKRQRGIDSRRSLTNDRSRAGTLAQLPGITQGDVTRRPNHQARHVTGSDTAACRTCVSTVASPE